VFREFRQQRVFVLGENFLPTLCVAGLDGAAAGFNRSDPDGVKERGFRLSLIRA